MTIPCPECEAEREGLNKVCQNCGDLGKKNDKRHTESAETVRDEDLEPYVALRYIARLFKVLAVLMLVMMIGEVVVGLITEGTNALVTLLGETTRLLVLAGLMWGIGDLAILLIDAGHDLRVSRILLGRIQAEVHKRIGGEPRSEESRDWPPRDRSARQS